MNLLFIGEDSINALLINLVGLIYELVSMLFRLFISLAKIPALDNNKFQVIIDNIYLVLATGMLFVIAFSLLKGMVTVDDTKSTEASTKIVKNFITSLLILIFLPTIFKFAFAFQNAIIDQNTIGKLLGNSMTATNSSDNLARAGNDMANTVFTAFFVPNLDHEICEDKNIKECKEVIMSEGFYFADAGQRSLAETEKLVANNQSFGIYGEHANNVSSGEIKFNFLISLLAGAYLVYVIFSFCLDLGVRIVKMVFYQVIAPIPVMFRIVPNSKISDTFNTWLKIVTTCYLEVFIRLIIIFFGVYLVSVLTTGEFLDDLMGNVGLLAKVVIILGIVTFIRQAPKLIGEVLGFDSGNMKLGIREKLKDGGVFQVGGALQNAALSSIRTARRFMPKDGQRMSSLDKKRMAYGMFRGITSGAVKGWKSNADVRTFGDMQKNVTKDVKDLMGKQDVRDAMFLRGKEIVGEGNENILTGYIARRQVSADNFHEFVYAEEAAAMAASKLFGEGISKVGNYKSANKSVISKLIKFPKETAIKKYGEEFANQFYEDRVDADGKVWWGVSRIEQEKQELDILQKSVDGLLKGDVEDVGLSLSGTIKQIKGKTKNKEYEVRLEQIQQDLESGKISKEEAYKQLQKETKMISEDLQKRKYDISANEDQLEKDLGEYIIDNYDKGTLDFKADTTDSYVALEQIRSYIRVNYGDIHEYISEYDDEGNPIMKQFDFNSIDKLSYKELRKIKDTLTIQQGEMAKKAAEAEERKKLQGDDK